jgi:hypothetical protein
MKMMVSLWWVTYPDGKNDGLIVMGDLPRKDDGLIMMGDLPRWNVGLIVMGDLPKKKMLVRAQRHTRKEVGLENALPEKWGLKGALKRR